MLTAEGVSGARHTVYNHARVRRASKRCTALSTRIARSYIRHKAANFFGAARDKLQTDAATPSDPPINEARTKRHGRATKPPPLCIRP